MIHYKYTEKQILGIMQFTGFNRNESIDYLNALIERDTKMIISMKQENKALDLFIASFNTRSIFLNN